MVVGDRSETLLEKNLRHIKELEKDIDGWKNELEYAKKDVNEQYEQFCKAMIEICQNTLDSLQSLSRIV